jgi:hypothetical protein
LDWRAVTVEPAPPPARAASSASGMRAWLEARRLEHGDELKKALRPAAEAEFGEAFSVRAFNAAYAACYRLGRGGGRAEVGERWIQDRASDAHRAPTGRALGDRAFKDTIATASAASSRPATAGRRRNAKATASDCAREDQENGIEGV